MKWARLGPGLVINVQQAEEVLLRWVAKPTIIEALSMPREDVGGLIARVRGYFAEVDGWLIIAAADASASFFLFPGGFLQNATSIEKDVSEFGTRLTLHYDHHVILMSDFGVNEWFDGAAEKFGEDHLREIFDAPKPERRRRRASSKKPK